MLHGKLGQSDLEQISAWLDGELDAPLADRVAARVADEPDWAAAAEQFRRVNAMLDAWTGQPLRRDLTDSILARAHRRRLLPSWVRVLAPLATAAAILIAAWVYYAGAPGSDNGRTLVRRPAGNNPPAPADPVIQDIERMVRAYPQEDRFVVENLDIARNYDVLKDFDTLLAIERIERRMEGS